MYSCRSTRNRLLGLLLILLIPMSCSRRPLPEVPAFEKLGFTDALDVVRRHAITTYEQWQEKPLDADRNGRLGMLLSTYGKNSASEVLYRRARTLAPGEFRWTYYLAMAVLQSGRYEEAAGMLREALKIDPETTSRRASSWQGCFCSSTTFEESIELYREITAEYPQRVEGWLGLGKALHRHGELAAAAAALQRARMIGPQYGEVHYALAGVLSASGDEAGAARELAVYERTAKNRIDTTDPLMREVFWLNAGDVPHTTKADYYLQRGQFEKPSRPSALHVAINPANQNAWGGLVESLAKLGQDGRNR